MTTTAREGLITLVKAKYRAAKANGAITFADSQLAEPSVAGLPFQLRYCPSLASKPVKDAPPTDSTPKKKFDPFENPSSELLISDTSDERPHHILVLNKFPIIANHFILATKANEQQTHLLKPEDLYQSYQCLSAWTSDQDDGSHEQRRLFGFFNSGDHSGASQPHRHVQFLPVEDIKGHQEGSWQLLTDKLATASLVEGSSQELRYVPSVPFVHFGLPISPEPKKAELFDAYILLLTAAIAATRRFRVAHPDQLALYSTDGDDLPISYNLGMTVETMMICPRKSDGRSIQRHDGSDIDYVALNGTILAASLMVKNEELFKVLQNHPQKLLEVLEAAGIPAGQGYDIFEEGELDPSKYPEVRNAIPRPKSGSL